MALQFSVAVRNARLDAIESTVGTSAKLQLRSGAPPATCATADSGTLLAELSLPSDWMAAASSGSVAKAGTWSGVGVAAGNAGHYRIKNSAGSTTHEQGTVTATGGGGDLTLDNVSIAVDQAITINTFTKTEPGA